MAAQSAPAVEYYWSAVRTVYTHVVVEHMVVPERLTQPFHVLAQQMLLPVEPPEVYTLCLSLAQYVLEHHLVEGAVLKIPRYVLR